ncbi:BTB/POZ and MATH domain-containing protein 4 [Apostasia shenzhenica]|uniref:BTB/POZ and MATH domain-containing protein 4 n=1 Tax=Apostasia shenzhenica TaxID=1088818 RepID=A0A2I0B0L7_9ASPA|nr:BTB/POZ and MATH domain-containing protein 4 [Apostasia shenzhenica]
MLKFEELLGRLKEDPHQFRSTGLFDFVFAGKIEIFDGTRRFTQMMPESIPPPDRDLSISPTRSRSVTETVNGSHKFVIQGYSLAKGMGIGKHIASDTFTVGGYQWAVYFYPDGKNPEDNSTYVSVFIALASEGTDVRALFELTLVDQSGKGKHKVHSHFDRSLESGPYTLKYRGSMCFAVIANHDINKSLPPQRTMPHLSKQNQIDQHLWTFSFRGYKRFFRRAALETSDYLKDDCLKINCTVGVVVSVMDCPRLHSIKVPESDMGVHFGMLLEKQEGSDVIFNVAGERFHAHKLVMAARSPVFKSMFFDGLKEAQTEIVITDLEPKVFKAMLHFIYKDNLDEDAMCVASGSPSTSISDTLAAKLLAVADKYGLGRLRLMCESYMCKDISVDSVASILALADRYHALDLKAACLRFTAENLGAVMRSSGFEYLRENCPSLQSELLKIIAGCEEECSSGGKSRSVWAQLSDGGDSNSRRVRPRTSH